jgi:3',5'-cyclic-AMP phosphodiesterase
MTHAAAFPASPDGERRPRVCPSLLAQLSDPHLDVGAGDRGSAEALAAAVAAVLALRPLPGAVVITGDVANGGAAAEYERVHELLEPLPMPVHVLAGNHDDRDALRERFGVPGSGPLQYVARCDGLRLVVCDTQRPGRDDGALDGGRLEWLEAQLAAEPDAPTIVAMHHPPVAIGLPVLDAIGVAEPDRLALGDLLARSPQVRRVVAGHVHRSAFGTLGGCGVFACASTHLQAPLEIGSQELRLVEEPPAIALHVALDGGLVSHVQPV